jgi:hypothetical protein
MPEEPGPQKRLGILLRQHRVGLDPQRYRNRRRFAEERGIPYHIAFRAEQGMQTTYEQDNKTVIELAYGLVPGSFDRSLSTGKLEILAAEQPDPQDSPTGDDPNRAYVEAMMPKLDEAQLAVLASLIGSWFSPPAARPADHERQTA